MAENEEAHTEAVRAVANLLKARGFDLDDAHFRHHGEVRVTSHKARAFSTPITVKVHGATQPPNCAVLAGNSPPTEDIVALVWLGEPSESQFLFLTNREARSSWLTNGKATVGWHRSGSRAFYGDNDSPPKPDNDSVRKLQTALPRP